MKSALPEKASDQGLSPRKTPAQSRAAATVEAILEGAATILEHQGFDGYTTNEIAARAGVSIGSLYQYFPNKDAVTIALIEREMVGIPKAAYSRYFESTSATMNRSNVVTSSNNGGPTVMV